MKLFDCHNHIQDERLFPALDKVMKRAVQAGITRMAVKGCCEADWPRVLDIVNRYSDTYFAFGLHPWFIEGRSSQWSQTLGDLLTRYPQASVGEIGIDHAVEALDVADQERVFLTQLRIAAELGRPATIHCRKAWGRLIELLDECGDLPPRMLIHCFGGSAETVTQLVQRGAYISFSGSITRANNRMAEAAIRAVPEDRLLIETDAPDILPLNVDKASCLMADGNPLNEPANLRLVLAKAAELRGISKENLAEITFRNAERFFDFQ